VLTLPQPMLARTGPLPTGKGWRYELKCDGFRPLVCSHGGRRRDGSTASEHRPAVVRLGVLPQQITVPTLAARIRATQRDTLMFLTEWQARGLVEHDDDGAWSLTPAGEPLGQAAAAGPRRPFFHSRLARSPPVPRDHADDVPPTCMRCPPQP